MTLLDSGRASHFLLNTISAVTGAVFGIPLALVVLQRVAASEADAAEARAARRFAARVSFDLASSAATLVQGGISGIQETRRYLAAQRRAAEAISDQEDGLQLDLDVAAQNVLRSVDALFVDERRALAEVSTQWSILSIESRSRLLESGGKWLSGLEARELSHLIHTVTMDSLENWRRRGLQIASTRFSRFPNDPYGAALDEWIQQVLDYLDAVEDLINKSANAARGFA